MAKKISGKTHTKEQLDNWANQNNPNNPAYRANLNNHANQMNPNNKTHQQLHNAKRRAKSKVYGWIPMGTDYYYLDFDN